MVSILCLEADIQLPEQSPLTLPAKTSVNNPQEGAATAVILSPSIAHSQVIEKDPIPVRVFPAGEFNVNVGRDWIDKWAFCLLIAGFLVQLGTLWVVWIYTEATKKLLTQSQNQTTHAQEQNVLAQEQILIAQKKMRHDEEIRLRAAMPVFVWKASRDTNIRGALEDNVVLEFENRGGPIVVLEARQIGLERAQANFSYLANGDRGDIVLSGWPDQLTHPNTRKVVYFGLRILTSIGERRDVVFRLETLATYPELEPQVSYDALGTPTKTVGVTEII